MAGKIALQIPTHQVLTVPVVAELVAWSKDQHHALDLKDLGCPGLVLRIGATGVASWSFRFGAGGQRLPLGKLAALTLKQARDAASKQRGKIADGVNPLQMRREAKAAMNMEELSAMFEREYLPQLGDDTQKEYKRLLKQKILPKFKAEKVVAITRPMVAKWHMSLPNGEKGRRSANYALAVLSCMMTKAELWGERPEGTNPCLRIPRFHEEKRQRYLRPDELQRLSGLLAQETAPEADAVRLLILTGFRLGELLGLRWPMVDLQELVVTFSAKQHKTGRKTGAKTLPLSLVAADLMAALPRGLRDERVLLLDEGMMERYWAALRIRAGLEDVHLHDLRHTFGSYGAARGVALKTLGGLMGHANTGTTDRYAHLDVDPLRGAVNVIGDVLAAAMKKAPEGA